MFLTTQACLESAAARGLFDVACPLAVPRDMGMSVLVTSPAHLLLVPVLRRYERNRLVAGLVAASIAVNAWGITWASLLGW